MGTAHVAGLELLPRRERINRADDLVLLAEALHRHVAPAREIVPDLREVVGTSAVLQEVEHREPGADLRAHAAALGVAVGCRARAFDRLVDVVGARGDRGAHQIDIGLEVGLHHRLGERLCALELRRLLGGERARRLLDRRHLGQSDVGDQPVVAAALPEALGLVENRGRAARWCRASTARAGARRPRRTAPAFARSARRQPPSRTAGARHRARASASSPRAARTTCRSTGAAGAAPRTRRDRPAAPRHRRAARPAPPRRRAAPARSSRARRRGMRARARAFRPPRRTHACARPATSGCRPRSPRQPAPGRRARTPRLDRATTRSPDRASGARTRARPSGRSRSARPRPRGRSRRRRSRTRRRAVARYASAPRAARPCSASASPDRDRARAAAARATGAAASTRRAPRHRAGPARAGSRSRRP